MADSSRNILCGNKKFQMLLNFLRSEIKTSQVKRDLGQAFLAVLVS